MLYLSGGVVTCQPSPLINARSMWQNRSLHHNHNNSGRGSVSLGYSQQSVVSGTSPASVADEFSNSDHIFSEAPPAVLIWSESDSVASAKSLPKPFIPLPKPTHDPNLFMDGSEVCPFKFFNSIFASRAALYLLIFLPWLCLGWLLFGPFYFFWFVISFSRIYITPMNAHFTLGRHARCLWTSPD